MGEPSSSPSEGTPRAQTPSMLSIYLERSQTSQSSDSQSQSRPLSASLDLQNQLTEAQLRQLGLAFSAEAIAGGPSPVTSGAVTTGQDPSLRARQPDPGHRHSCMHCLSSPRQLPRLPPSAHVSSAASPSLAAASARSDPRVSGPSGAARCWLLHPSCSCDGPRDPNMCTL